MSAARLSPEPPRHPELVSGSTISQSRAPVAWWMLKQVQQDAKVGCPDDLWLRAPGECIVWEPSETTPSRAPVLVPFTTPRDPLILGCGECGSLPLPFRGGDWGVGPRLLLTMVLNEPRRPHPSPSPEGEGLNRFRSLQSGIRATNMKSGSPPLGSSRLRARREGVSRTWVGIAFSTSVFGTLEPPLEQTVQIDGSAALAP